MQKLNLLTEGSLEGLRSLKQQAATALAEAVQGTETLLQAAGVRRVANEAALAGQPAGIYELTGSNERLEWTGNAVKAGSRSPSLQPAVVGLLDYARGGAVQDGPLGVPVKDERLLHWRGRVGKFSSDPYGMRENATVVSIIASPEPDPAVEILGFNNRAESNTYSARDNAALFVAIHGRAPMLSMAAQTTYTATTAVAPGIDFSTLKRGMWIDTLHKNAQGAPDKWSGLLLSWDSNTNTLTVDYWTRSESTGEKGTPANGVALIANSQTAIWANNTIFGLYPHSQARIAYGVEITGVNTQADYDPTQPHSAQTRVIMQGNYLIGGKRGYVGMDVGGNNYFSYRALGGYKANYHSGHHPGNAFQNIPAQSPENGFLDDSRAAVSFRSVGAPNKQFGSLAEGAHAEAGVGIATSGAYGLSVFGDGNTITKIHTQGAGSHLMGHAGGEANRLGYNLTVTPDMTFFDLGGGVGLSVNVSELPGKVLRLNNVDVFITDAHVRAKSLQINDQQVVGPRLPGVKKSDGTLADNQRAINELIDRMVAHGLIAPL